MSAWLIISAQLRPAPHRSANSSAAQRRAVPCPTMPCRALQLSSAAHRSASSAERSAVRCRALPCCVLCCTFSSSCMLATYQVSYHVPVLLIPHQVCTYYVVELRSARLYMAVQRSAEQCGAVPCPSFCGAMSCGAVRSFEHTAVVPGMIQVPGTIITAVLCTRLLAVFSCDCPLSVPMHIPANTTRTAVQNLTSTSTAQRRAISSAQAPQLSSRTE